MGDELTPELADYLIAVAHLVARRGGSCCARLVEVSELLGVARPTASLMLGKLYRMGLIIKSEEGVGLSRCGREVAEAIVRKHEVLEAALLRYGIDHDRACEIARKLESTLEEEDVSAIERSLEEPRKTCGNPLCRLESALKARGVGVPPPQG